jgi:N-acetylglucosaminyldiphosphoundecaprenol N-acetyl-beta-D-mannosaminyltransferase
MRDTYSTFGVLGVPVDDFEIDELIDRIDQAVVSHDKLLISTVNTNFLVNSSLNPGFRQSLLESDVCTVDGVGMLLMCRLAFVQDVGRVSGADLMQRLVQRSHTTIGRPLRVFFFGGNEAIADMARRAINRTPSAGICCVGSLNPGFGSMDDLSSPHLIKIINDARPDFLVVALGAERGQEWLLRNRASLNVPVASHLGAAVNFVAGVIERAPRY